MESLRHDLRFACRVLCTSRGFTSVAVLTLAIGIGANTAIFGLVNGAFFRPLPYAHAERLAFLWQNNRRSGESEGAVSYPNFADWRAQSRCFEDMAFIMFAKEIFGGTTTAQLLNTPSGLERVPGVLVSTNFFSVLASQPLIGRNFAPADALGGKAGVVIISQALWKSRFASDPHAIGRPLDSSDGQGDIVVGIMPPGFNFPPGTQIWRPRELPKASAFDLRLYPNMGVIGRLSSGVTWSQAQTEMDTIAARLAAQYPQDDGGIGIRMVPFRKQLSEKVSQGLLLLWAAIFGVLLIACVNVANLMAARAADRQKEIAVRFSLGATRSRIIRQFLAESFLLTATGGAAGSFLAFWTPALVSKFNADIARLGGRMVDPRVLLYTIALAALTAILCAMIPAFSVTRLDLNRTLHETGSGSAAGGTELIGKILIVSEVALAFILLAGSGLLIRSLRQIFSVNPGFDAEDVYRLRVYFPSRAGPSDGLDARFVHITDALRALPGVTAVASTSNALFPDEMFKGSVVIEGRADPHGQSSASTAADATPDLFRAMGIPLLRGREFTPADAARNAPPVVIINQTMARLYWRDENPLGKRFKFGDPNYRQPWQTIVGVVGDVREEGLEKSPGAVVYVPSAGYSGDDIVVRAGGHAATLLAAIRAQVREVDRNSLVDSFQLLSEALSAHESGRRLNAWLLGAFAGVAVLLAAVGIYGSVSYWTMRRTQEIGVRMALGAQPRNIFTLVVGGGMAVIFVGLALGIAGALALTRLMASLLFGVKPSDPFTYAAVALLLAAVAFAAAYFPARRAMRVEPMEALRYH